MPIEIEIKIKVDDHGPLRSRLSDLGATRVSHVIEINTFFDTAYRSLQKDDRGLRLRTNTNLADRSSTHILTYKGPRAGGPIKKREEIEVAVGDPAHASKLFESLGYRITVSFEKRRETWRFNDCTIELDELPLLGTYVEIEGPTEAAVLDVRAKLNLDHRPTITDPYVALLEAELARIGSSSRVITF
jgi:adenylate cyclase class 2